MRTINIARLRRTIRCARALFIFCFIYIPAAASKDAKIGEVSLSLPQPAGYCELDPVQASDAPLIAKIHGTLGGGPNRLLVLSADCNELSDWRNGKRQVLDHIAEYQTVRPFENGPLPDTPEKVLRGYCDEMRRLGDRSMGETSPGTQERAEQAFKIARLNQMIFLGVLAEEALVCYGSLLQKLKVETGEEKTQVAVFATTILKGKVVLFYLFAPYVSRETVMQMLTKHRVNVGRLQHANRN